MPRCQDTQGLTAPYAAAEDFKDAVELAEQVLHQAEIAAGNVGADAIGQ